MMFQSVMSDLSNINEIIISCTRDERLTEILSVADVTIIKAGDDPYEVWKNQFNSADASIIIAPETDNVLYDLINLSERCACKVLGCTKQAVAITASKFQTYTLLRSFGIDSPKTYKVNFTPQTAWESGAYPCVLKPDRGVGAEDCYIVNNPQEIDDIIINNTSINDWIIQEYIEGINASIIMLCYQQSMRLLAVNQQRIDIKNNRITLTGIDVNGLYDHKAEAESLAEAIVGAVPGLAGIIGFDCLFTQNKTYVVDINPRFTTSYAGLATSIDFNPMYYMIELFTTNSLPKLQHQQYKMNHLDLCHESRI